MLMDRSRIRHIHLVGIGGSAMVNVAAGLKQMGYRVTGSDGPVYPPSSTVLQHADIPVLPFQEENLNGPDLFVIGNAIPRGNPEVEALLNNRQPMTSMPEIIRDFFVEDRKLILVTGTHGKTTTTAMVVHMLMSVGIPVSFMLGGVPVGWDGGFRHDPDSRVFVLEGDEYDTAFFDKTSKFLKFSPDCLIINALEFDHGDIFRDLEDIRRSFRFLLRRTPSRATVIANVDDTDVRALEPVCRSVWKRFGMNATEKLDGRVCAMEGRQGRIRVTADVQGVRCEWEWKLPGVHNAMNAVAAALGASAVGVKPDDALKALGSFRGVMRRFQIHLDSGPDGIQIIEDFAHHPTAIRNTIAAARELYPGRRIVAVVEPATNSIRSGMFQEDLTESMETSDMAVLLPIPPRGRSLVTAECPAPVRAGSDIVQIGARDAFREFLNQKCHPGDMLLFMSNGNLQGFLETAREWAQGAFHDA